MIFSGKEEKDQGKQEKKKKLKGKAFIQILLKGKASIQKLDEGGKEKDSNSERKKGRITYKNPI